MKPKKKILIFIDWYLPGFKAGGPIRSCANLVAHLSSSFEFYIITRDTDYCESKPYHGVTSNKWTSLTDNVNVFYVSADKLSYYYLEGITQTLSFDVVYVNGVYSKNFSIYPLLLFQKKETPVIVAARGMLAQSAIGVKSFKKKLFLKLAALLGLYRNVIFHATNTKEKEDIIREVGSKTVVRVAPNLHKLNFKEETTPIEKKVNELRLVSIARVSPEKNLLQLLEALSTQTENITLDIYGTQYNKGYWEKCKEQIDSAPVNIKINYKGVIEPNQIESTIEKYHFLVLLSLGENFGHVILESFMAARPVIISNQTPWSHLIEKCLGWDIALNSSTEINSVLTSAAKMTQAEFDVLINSCKNYAQTIISDKDIIKQSVTLFCTE